MRILVQKYGGSSVANPDKIKKVAARVAAAKRAGHDLCVVVSAMGDTTDELLGLAKRVSPNPHPRELDMLLTTGERVSMALLSMALHDEGVEAISFTGSQSGIVTNDSHTNARIVEVRPYRIQDELARGRVVIVAGYQGVSYKKEITTLGRGGSDTTAVALAAALGAEACEIYSDVDGVWSADPRVVNDARKIEALSYQEMQEFAESGAKVLNAQAVEFAKEKNIAIYARSSFGGGEGTVVRKDAPRAPGRAMGVAHEKDLARLTVEGEEPAELLGMLDAQGVSGKQLTVSDGKIDLLLSLENLHRLGALRDTLQTRYQGRAALIEGMAAVSAIGAGINASYLNLRQGLAAMNEARAPVLAIHTSSFRITFLTDPERLAEAARALHAALVEG